MPVIGTSHFWPIITLIEKLDELERKVPNEVQTSNMENGYSVGIISLAVFLLESAIGRAQHLDGIQPPMRALDYVTDSLGQEGLGADLEELFVLRDVIAHNHLWDAEITYGKEGNLRLV